MYFENAEILFFLDFCIVHNEEIYIEIFIPANRHKDTNKLYQNYSWKSTKFSWIVLERMYRRK